MRKVTLLFFILLSIGANAQNKILKIHLKTGYTALFSVSRVDSVTYGSVMRVHQSNGNIVSFSTSVVDRVSYGNDSDVVTDIDDNVYQTVTIGVQTWMADNLRTTLYRNGTGIINATDNTTWQNNTTGAWDYYSNNGINNYPYGKLYNWYAVNHAYQLCPPGWHVPTHTDWTILSNYLGGYSVAGAKLKSTGTTYWTSPNQGAVNTTGFSGLPGGLRSGSGVFSQLGNSGYFWSATDSAGVYGRSLNYDTIRGLDWTLSSKNTGLTVRCVKNLTPEAPALVAITSLNCAAAINSGYLVNGESAAAVSTTIPYSGGNAGFFNEETISSTGVTGLTATLSAGNAVYGNGVFIFTITGTPASAGTASFSLSIGGQTCTFTRNVNPPYPAGSVHCGTPAEVVDVTNPTTGRTWMDRNLGASRAATSSSDANAFGDLYQWGRGTDGHQCRNSNVTSVLSSTDQPTHANFITVTSANYDWRSSQNINLWQGVNGTNNPCPSGYRLPTETELSNERSSWSSANNAGAFASQLKLPVGGYRYFENAALLNVGTDGFYWSSTINGNNSRNIYFGSGAAAMYTNFRAYALSVRCIKDVPAVISTLNCAGASSSGTLSSGSVATGVSSSIAYTGGNSGIYVGQTISSTGVTGLTATLAEGTLANGNGNLIYTITGTPNASGTASFALSIGGKNCTLTRNVNPPYPEGAIHCGGAITEVIEVTNPSTGRIWMDRNLGASRVATTVNDANAYGDLYQWGRRGDGHQCRNATLTSSLSSIDQPTHGSYITVTAANYDWRSPQNNNLWQGVNGTNNPCPSGFRIPTETELNAERSSWSSNNSTGAFTSPLKFSVGGHRYFENGTFLNVGNDGYYWSSTVNGTSSRNFYFGNSVAGVYTNFRGYAFSVRCIKDLPAVVTSLNCAGAVHNGTLTNGEAASGVSTTVSYTGGNTGTYASQSINSTGVTGLTATLTDGTLANGSGTLSFSITGTPAASGTASFALSIGGQSCTFTRTVNVAYPAGTTHCGGAVTVVTDVTNPSTGKTWMDRNLGASRVATASNDANAYGDLYQWGRRADGHQCRNSGVTSTLSSSDQPAHGNYITVVTANYDWRSPQNTNLWQGVNGTNNPCPNGYRIPTETELSNERASWSATNSAGGFASPLKWSVGGYRYFENGTLLNVGSDGFYWSSTVNGTNSRNFYFGSGAAAMYNNFRAYAFSVRCIKD